MKSCAICSEPLSADEERLNAQWHFACEKCHYCESPMPSPDQIQKCLTKGIPPSHDTCHYNHIYEQFKSKDFVVGIQHIQYLNTQICEFWPAVDPSTTDIALIQDGLIKIQELAKNMSWILGLSKEKILIKESRLYQQLTTERKEKIKTEQFESEKEKLARQQKSEQLKAEREDPALRTRRKAAEGYAQIMGLSIEQAYAFLDSQIKSKDTPK